MIVLISALAFFVLLSFLVLIHELGHFLAARRAGVVVEEFGFGLPPRAKGLFVKGGTLFSLNWVPFGGFVRLQGENAISQSDRNRLGSFARASFPAKVSILVAGVFMNFLVAMTIFTVGFSVWGWIPTYTSFAEMRRGAEIGDITLKPGVRVGSVLAASAAKEAGILPGSIILSVEGKEVYDPREVLEAQKNVATVHYELQTPAGQRTEATLRLRGGKAGVVLEGDPRIESHSRSIGRGFVLSLREARVMTVQTVKGLVDLGVSLFSRGKVPEGVTGIVGIAVMTHETVALGWSHYLRLVAILSLSLAILNILPFPALDGGRLAFVVTEFLLRRPVPRRFEVFTNTAGFLFLIGLILLITYHDIFRLVFPVA